MNWWTWYLSIGVLVSVLVVAWDWYAGMSATSDARASDRAIMVMAAMAVAPVWPIVLFLQSRDIAKYIADPPQRYVTFRFARRHLVRRVSVQEVEDLERVVDPLRAVPDIPFGFLNGTWRNFHSQLKPLDSLWVLSARATSGFQMEERKGYAIVRFGWIRRTMIISRIEIGEEE